MPTLHITERFSFLGECTAACHGNDGSKLSVHRLELSYGRRATPIAQAASRGSSTRRGKLRSHCVGSHAMQLRVCPSHRWDDSGFDRSTALRPPLSTVCRVSPALSVRAVDSTLQEKQPMLQRLHTIAIRPELSILFILEAMTIMPVIIIGHQKKTQPGKYDDLHANRFKRLSMQAAASIIHHEHDRYERLWAHHISGCRATQCKQLHAYTQRLRQSEV